MGQCFGRDVVVSAEEKQTTSAAASSSSSRSFSTTSSKRFSSSSSSSPSSPQCLSPASFSLFGLHSGCISSATKQSLAFVKKQRAKLYIVRRCVTMLILWHKYGDV